MRVGDDSANHHITSDSQPEKLVYSSNQKIPAILGDGDFMTVDDAADYVCRTIRTIRRWGKLGMLPRSRRLGREVYIHRADLDELLKPAWSE